MLLKIVLLSLLVSLATAQCTDSACQAFVWGYPLWHSINQRFLNQQNSPLFQLNAFSARVSAVPDPVLAQTPQLALCNATLCSGNPFVLNPSPVVAPNVDTIYGAFTWDLGTLNVAGGIYGGALKFVLPSNAQTVYTSVVFYDLYTNVVQEVNSLTVPDNTNVLLCLSQISGHPACTAAGGVPLQLPRYGFAIVRGFSTGAIAPVCGINNCQYLLGIAQNFGILYVPTNLQQYTTVYNSFMSNFAPAGTTCPYLYGQPPCGTTGNKNAFWGAICQAVKDNPLTGDEATYVNNNFAGLGITATGCTPSINFTALNAGFNTGYGFIRANLANTGVTSGPWTFIPFTGNWNVKDAASSLLRAITSFRLEYMNSNAFAAYWVAFTDSTGQGLDGGSGNTYKVIWQSADNFVNTARGFWSLTLYDSTFFLYNPPSDQYQYAYRGTGAAAPTQEVHISNTCVNTNCIRANPGSFNLMLRAYAPLPNILPTGGAPTYPLPQIVKCDCNSPCN